jgi:hypothetical protein
MGHLFLLLCFSSSYVSLLCPSLKDVIAHFGSLLYPPSLLIPLIPLIPIPLYLLPSSPTHSSTRTCSVRSSQRWPVYVSDALAAPRRSLLKALVLPDGHTEAQLPMGPTKDCLFTTRRDEGRQGAR